MTFDIEKMLESKAAARRKLAALPISEKLRMLDAMRERELLIRTARVKSSDDEAHANAENGDPH